MEIPSLAPTNNKTYYILIQRLYDYAAPKGSGFQLFLVINKASILANWVSNRV